jgi:hypothetical protein
MKVYLVSQRGWIRSVSCDPLYELEDLIAKSCGGTVLAPRIRPAYEKATSSGSAVHARLLRGLLRRTVGPYERLMLPPKSGPELLISVGIAGFDLEIATAIPEYRHRFDLVVGYVFDAWGGYPEVASTFDRVFVPLPDEMGEWKKRVGVEGRLLPFGVDALVEGGSGTDRPIDLLSYGRIPAPFRDAFSRAFTHPKSKRLFLRTEARKPLIFTHAPPERSNERADYQLLYQLLRRSKASLCFDTLYPGMRKFPYSFVTLRWFDAMATGAAAVGKRPTTPEADRLMPWPESTVELPDDPEAAVEVLEQLFEDTQRLRRIQLRNRYEALARHDWRLRVRDMFQDLGVSVPSGLKTELAQLEEQTLLAKQEAQDGGAL